MASLNLITSFRGPFPNTATSGVWASTYNFGKDTSIPVQSRCMLPPPIILGSKQQSAYSSEADGMNLFYTDLQAPGTLLGATMGFRALGHRG